MRRVKGFFFCRITELFSPLTVRVHAGVPASSPGKSTFIYFLVILMSFAAFLSHFTFKHISHNLLGRGNKVI